MIDDILGPLQHRIMKILWVEGPLTVHGVNDCLKEQARHPELAYTTVLTVCRNLVRRKAATSKPNGRSHLFEASLTEQEYHLAASQHFVAEVFGGNIPLALKVIKSLE